MSRFGSYVIPPRGQTQCHFTVGNNEILLGSLSSRYDKRRVFSRKLANYTTGPPYEKRFNMSLLPLDPAAIASKKWHPQNPININLKKL